MMLMVKDTTLLSGYQLLTQGHAIRKLVAALIEQAQKLTLRQGLLQ